MEQNKETIMKDNKSGEFLTPPKDQIKTILVDNCQECSFYWVDSGYYGCDINKEIEQFDKPFPKDKVHDKCPLKNMNYRIRLR